MPNRSSFEVGTAELGFSRDQNLPSEEEVNKLFNDMLVTKENLKVTYSNAVTH